MRRTTAIARSNDASLAAFFAADVVEASQISGSCQKQVEALLSSDVERQLFQRVGERRKAFLDVRDTISRLKQDGRQDEALALMDEKFLPVAKSYLAGLRELQTVQRQHIDRLSQEIQSGYRASSWLLLVLGASCSPPARGCPGASRAASPRRWTTP